MSAKFHAAVFCSASSYEKKKAFYAKLFESTPREALINDGSQAHEYFGSCWAVEEGNLFSLLKDTLPKSLEENLDHVDFVFDGYIFALLKNPSLSGAEERLAHIGFFFDRESEFEAAIQKRNLNEKNVKLYPNGTRQIFDEDKDGIEWEFTYQPPAPN